MLTYFSLRSRILKSYLALFFFIIFIVLLSQNNTKNESSMNHFIDQFKVLPLDTSQKLSKDIPEKISCTQTNDSQYWVNLESVRYPQYVPLHFNKSINFTCLNERKSLKTILFWNKFYGHDSFYYGIGKRDPFVKNFCPVTNCEITNDKTRLAEADLVLVSVLDQTSPIPKSRPPNQKWVFDVIESPVHTPDFSHYNEVFNMTATYLAESDFANSYENQAEFFWRPNASFNVDYDFYADKIDFAAALISNCGAGTRRIEYVTEMQKFVPVKIFGKCGNSCPSNLRTTNKPADCKQIIGKEFKFFLAFENSVCRDYITEKFFHMLRYNIIQVVLGGGNYSRFVR